MRLVTYRVGGATGVGALEDDRVRVLAAPAMVDWLAGRGREPTGETLALEEVRLRRRERKLRVVVDESGDHLPFLHGRPLEHQHVLHDAVGERRHRRRERVCLDPSRRLHGHAAAAGARVADRADDDGDDLHARRRPPDVTTRVGQERREHE